MADPTILDERCFGLGRLHHPPVVPQEAVQPQVHQNIAVRILLLQRFVDSQEVGVWFSIDTKHHGAYKQTVLQAVEATTVLTLHSARSSGVTCVSPVGGQLAIGASARRDSFTCQLGSNLRSMRRRIGLHSSPVASRVFMFFFSAGTNFGYF